MVIEVVWLGEGGEEELQIPEVEVPRHQVEEEERQHQVEELHHRVGEPQLWEEAAMREGEVPCKPEVVCEEAAT